MDPQHLLRFFHSKQPGKRVVALRQIAGLMDAVELLLFREVRGNRWIELDPPHRVVVPRNECAISLLALPQRVVFAFPAQFRGSALGEDLQHCSWALEGFAPASDKGP